MTEEKEIEDDLTEYKEYKASLQEFAKIGGVSKTIVMFMNFTGGSSKIKTKPKKKGTQIGEPREHKPKKGTQIKEPKQLFSIKEPNKFNIAEAITETNDESGPSIASDSGQGGEYS